MKFNLNHDPNNKTLAIPRAALQLSGLAGVSDLILHTDSGCILLLPGDPTVTTVDGREKPFEMKMQFHKAVVKVLVIVATDRTKTPVSLTFEDGKEYSIDRVCSRQRAAATKVGGTGIRYTIMIGGRQTYLFEDEDQWFVEAKNLHV